MPTAAATTAAPGSPPPAPEYKVLEDTVRTLLGVLQTLTGLDAVYLTRVDADSNTQETIFAGGARHEKLADREGVVVPWRDTLCWRTIEDGVPYTQHADAHWPDSHGVRELRIRTYLSEPLRSAAGLLIGTLCALADRRVPITQDTLHVVAVFARLIAHHLDCTTELSRAQQHNSELASSLTVDPLTGVANRRGLMDELNRALAHAARNQGHDRVVVAFIDLDRFKAVNDLYGHRLGDRFLVALAGRLAVATRAGETIARYGGDEFVVIGHLHPQAGDEPRLAERFAAATRGDYRLDETLIHYAGASVGTAVASPGEDAEALLHRADRAMYEVKQRRSHAPVAVDSDGLQGRDGTYPTDA